MFLRACVGFISAQSSLLDRVPWYLDLNKVLTFYRILSWCPLLGVNTEERKKDRKKERLKVEVLFVNLYSDENTLCPLFFHTLIL